MSKIVNYVILLLVAHICFILQAMEKPSEEKFSQLTLSAGIIPCSISNSIKELKTITTEELTKRWAVAEQDNKPLIASILKDRFKQYQKIQSALKSKCFDVSKKTTREISNHVIPFLVNTCPAMDHWLILSNALTNSDSPSATIQEISLEENKVPVDLDLNSNSSLLLVHYDVGNIIIYDLTSDVCIQKKIYSKIVRASFNTQGNRIFIKRSNNFECWDSRTQALLDTQERPNRNVPLYKSKVRENDQACAIHDSSSLKDSHYCIVANIPYEKITSVFFLNKEQGKIVIQLDDGICLLDGHSGDCISEFEFQDSKSVVFNAQGTLMASLSEDKKEVNIENAITGALLLSFGTPDKIEKMAFDEKGDKIALYAENSIHIVTIIKPETRQCLLNNLTLEQAALLIYAYECCEKNETLDFRNVPELLDPFEQLDDWLKEILKKELKIITFSG